MVKVIFNLKEFLTKRDAWAGTFDVALNGTNSRTDCLMTLGEPQKTREATTDKNAKLREFQLELVQLFAAFNGDHKNESYPDKVVENMIVGELVKYTETCFKGFFEGWSEGEDDNGVEALGRPWSRGVRKTTEQKREDDNIGVRTTMD
ncbi:hypothetical protein Syun_006612 [Stephania yunnanensis]|uniref:Uncharacterized protein n=1 Tax=Stephania yunnanensis TaxID=152371 RepID=A0AAP0Q1I7_9MAGN